MSRQTEAGRGGPRADGGGRMAAVERRRQIVQVAMRLFSERGFRGTTTKEIAQAAGVSEAIIFRHFATKDELYAAIIDDKSCEGMGFGRGVAEGVAHEGHTLADGVRHCVGDAMERGDDRAVFEGIALTMMEHHARDPQFLRLLLYSALEGHELAQIFWDRNVPVMYEFLASYIRRRQREGAFRDLDPYVAVRALTGAVIHHSLTNILWDREPSRRLLNLPNEEAARAITDVFLRGVSAGQGAGAASRGARRQGPTNKGRKK